MKYVRCKYCDSDFNIDGLKHKKVPKEKKVKHEKVEYLCTACGYNTTSFVFAN